MDLITPPAAFNYGFPSILPTNLWPIDALEIFKSWLFFDLEIRVGKYLVKGITGIKNKYHLCVEFVSDFI